MMKKFKIFILTFCIIFPLCSCINSFEKVPIKEHDYSEVEKNKINANLMYFQANPEYFVYIYSHSCLHCERIKDEVISYSLSNKYPLYFCEYSNEIKLADIEENLIGFTCLEETKILGTPALIQIKNKKVEINVSGDDLVLSILREFYT